MSVERAHGYHSGDRIIHVDPEDGEIVEPLGGYVPMQRLVGAAAVANSAERWLADHPLGNLTGEGGPYPSKNIDDESVDGPLLNQGSKTEEDPETIVVSDEDLEELTNKALVHAQ